MSTLSLRPQPPPFAGRPPQPPLLQTQTSVTGSVPTPPTPPAPPTPVDPLPPPRSLSYPDFEPTDAQDNPRKYSGYRVFSRWMASDQAFFILRRFSTLNTRVLLAMQDEIVELEDQLNLLDEEASRKETPDNVDNGTIRDDPFGDRRTLVTKTLPEKLSKYNAFINEYSQLMARPQVREDDITNVKRWLAPVLPESFEDLEKAPLKYLGPIDQLEAEFIEHHDDLITVQPKSRSWFRNVLERTLILKTPVIRPLFERRPEEYETINTNAKTIWQNDKRVEGLSGTIVAVIGLGMLLGPLWLLQAFPAATVQARLAIITGFITLFFVLVAVATTARIFDALAAAAAYSAVLMVFLNAPSSSL